MVVVLTLFGLLAIVLLTAISGFFSSSELAVFSVPDHRIDSLVASNVPGSTALAKLRDDPHRFLVTALVSNNIAAASVATAVFVQFLPAGQAATGSTGPSRAAPPKRPRKRNRPDYINSFAAIFSRVIESQ